YFGRSTISTPICLNGCFRAIVKTTSGGANTGDICCWRTPRETAQSPDKPRPATLGEAGGASLSCSMRWRRSIRPHQHGNPQQIRQPAVSETPHRLDLEQSSPSSATMAFRLDVPRLSPLVIGIIRRRGEVGNGESMKT